MDGQQSKIDMFIAQLERVQDRLVWANCPEDITEGISKVLTELREMGNGTRIKTKTEEYNGETVNTIEYLRAAIKTVEKNRIDEQRMLEIEKKAEEESKRRIEEYEKKPLSERIKLAEKIFEWCEQFSKTDEFNDLGRHSVQVYQSSLWGIKSGWGDYGCCSKSLLSWNENMGSVELIIWDGYEWIGGEEKIFTEPIQLAEAACFEYISRFWDHIKSGKVYTHIGDYLVNNRH